MEFLLITLGIILTVLFFLNIKSAAFVLCRIVGGFAFLLIYNTLAQLVSLPSLGVNIVTASLCGILGLPGGVMILCLSLCF